MVLSAFGLGFVFIRTGKFWVSMDSRYFDLDIIPLRNNAEI